MDPLAGTPWSLPATVGGFSSGQPNPVLMAYARELVTKRPHAHALDIGCGAGRNAIPLALAGYRVHGIDLSAAMIRAARDKADAEGTLRCLMSLASMTALPIRDNSMDLIVAHGIWNLAQRDDQLRGAIREAARVARRDARLFVFTFSRRSLPDRAQPIAGQQFIFRGTNGADQCFLTAEQLVSELACAGMVPDPRCPLVEHPAPRAGAVHLTSSAVFLAGGFIRQP